MKSIFTNLRYFILILLALSAIQSFAQCQISYSGNLCVGNPIVFSCGTIGASNYSWNFNGEDSNFNLCDPVCSFSTAGTKVIHLSLKLNNGSKCNTQISIEIKDVPKVLFALNSPQFQCFHQNKFCFTDSSTIQGDSICKREFIIDDGTKYTLYGNGKVHFCHGFQDPSGGTYGLTVVVYSCNGCISSKRFEAIARVRPSMGVIFTSPQPQACDSLQLLVTNNSSVFLDSLFSFEWDWGDGTKTIGDRNSPAKWKLQIAHWYKTQGPKSGSFDIKLTAIALNGCVDSFIYPYAATLIVPKLTIIASQDSVCISNPIIQFNIKEGPLPLSSNPLFIFEIPTIPNNISRTWSAQHSFSTPGVHMIKFSYTHAIPGCARTFTDTILVLGPQSNIEFGEPKNISSAQRYQCVIKDTIHFTNYSLYYHNDKKFSDDDSVLIQPKGFNAPLVHVFNFANQSSVNPLYRKRSDDNILSLWDFDDDYCEKCTTDSKIGLNTSMNCRYSRDLYPKHLFTDWESIYMNQFASKAQIISKYNKDSAYVESIKVWADDSLAICRDTILYYGDNPLGRALKDSSVYASISNKIARDNYLNGPSTTDFYFNKRLYIRANDTLYLDSQNGLPPTMYTGPKYLTVSKGQRLIIHFPKDTVFIVNWFEYIQDTIPLVYSSGKKVWHTILNPLYNSGDSISASTHRKRFYEGKTVRCFAPVLYQKDIRHPLACSSESSIQLSLMPASAKNLRKSGTLCLGSDRPDYGITFILDETKPGCNMSWAEINFNTQVDSNNWQAAVGKNLSSGSISMGDLPPANPPFLIYPGSRAPGNHFSTIYNENDIVDKDGYVDIGLIIGNGIHPNGVYPQECQDTVYYKKFARFPVLDDEFRVLSGMKIDDAYSFCKRDEIVVSTMPFNNSHLTDIGKIEWSIESDKSGKYYDKVYTLKVSEIYKRNIQIHKDSGFLMDSLSIIKTKQFDDHTQLISSQTIPISKVTKWHRELDISAAYEQIKNQMLNYGLNITDFNSEELDNLIWNGKGTIGQAYTGSKGLIDTAGFGHLINFTIIADSKQILHWKDTSILPIESHLGADGKTYHAYNFFPEYSGFYQIGLSLNTGDAKSCGKTNLKKAVVGFYMNMNFADTIVCPGRVINTSPNIRYFETSPEIRSNFLDPTDYWRTRIIEAGNFRREGYTKTDLNKDDDDISDPKTIFGAWPYSITGLDNAPFNILQIATPNSLYYNADTGKTYIIRTAASDSLGCKDTFVQNLHVIAPRAKIKLDLSKPNCSFVAQIFDSSYFQDPLKDIRGQSSSVYTHWIITWGDNSVDKRAEFFNTFPNNVTHQYLKNGHYLIKMSAQSSLGCTVFDSLELSLPGPIVVYDTFFSSIICRNDKLLFDNLSLYNAQDTNDWIWDFGDMQYGQQYAPLNSANNPISHVYSTKGTFYPVLHLYYKSSGPNAAFCHLQYPDAQLKDLPISVNVIKCDSNDIQFMSKYNNVKMYPNPALNTVQFETDKPLRLLIYNTLGELVAELEVSGQQSFDLSYLNSGLYYVKTVHQITIGKLIINSN